MKTNIQEHFLIAVVTYVCYRRLWSSFAQSQRLLGGRRYLGQQQCRAAVTHVS